MASKEKRIEREKIKKESENEQLISAGAGTTDMFKCSKCKQRNCSYYQLQTRSAVFLYF
jgi:transcription elongation factor S-II